MEDDYPNGVGGNLAVGGSATANIETAGDVDAFVVTLEAGETYQFDVTGVGLASLFDPVLRLSNPSGVQVADNDDFGGSRDPRIEYTATSSGTHFLYVNGFGTGTGSFQISATQTSQPPITTFDDYPEGTSGFVGVGSSTTGNIETSADTDFFSVFLQEGYTYRLTARGSDTDDGTLADPVIDLYDPSGTYLQSDNDTGFGRNAEFSSFVASSTGTYQMAIYSADFTSTGTYFVSASEIAGPPITTFDDYPTGTSGSLTVGSSTTGNIETAGDTDAFTVLLEDGVTYRFDLSENSSQGGLTLDPFLQLTTSTGSVITFDNDSGPSADARIEFTPTFFGVYVLSAEGVGSSTGLYEISATEVTTTSFDDYPTGTSGSVTVGGSTSGNIETAGDTDTFNVFLQAGFTYQFDLISSTDSGIVSLSDPFLRLTDGSGSVFITNNNGGSGLNSRITDFTPTSSGVYFLDAEGTGSSTGVYQISATQTGTPSTQPPATTVDDYPTGTTGPLSMGGSRTGDIETGGDLDVFSVFLQAGFTYQFDMRGAPTSNGTLADPSLQLRDSEGSFLTANDDGGTGLNASITNFTPTTSGSYLLYAQGQSSSITGTYQVSATQTAGPPTSQPTPGPGPTEPTAPEYVQTIILLYEAALNRNGNYDWDGVNFWIDRYESGTSYQTISRSFLNSPEFENKYGEPLNEEQSNYISNTTFVNTMYMNVLDRSGDPSGLQYWNSVLQGNGNRESVLLNFARSPENFTNNDEALDAIYDAGDGYWLI